MLSTGSANSAVRALPVAVFCTVEDEPEKGNKRRMLLRHGWNETADRSRKQTKGNAAQTQENSSDAEGKDIVDVSLQIQ